MTNIDLTNDLITAIHFDRFAEIEARHHPAATFRSFLGPDLFDSVAISDWHRRFLRDYADCDYTDPEYIDAKDTVVVRATVEAKGFDWRRFTQNMVEVLRFEDDVVAERRQYAMLRNIEFDKPQTRAMEKTRGDRKGKSRGTRKAVEALYTAILAGDTDAAKEHLADDLLLVDSVYGIVLGAEPALELLLATPRPAFGTWHATNQYNSDQNALVELAIDPARPRLADWIRMVEDKVAVIERHWMLREIGMLSALETNRHTRRVIQPI